MPEEKMIRSYITITNGMRGYFAVHVGVFKDEEGNEYIDPLQTGIGSFATRDGAIPEAKMWAEDEGVEYRG